ncbi:MAG: DUF1670 domain-containing protein [Chloroflexi bacterium]|nr:MAG: DUF1670 domain-containing protein [Chloroflexota bacterium]
MTQKKPNLIKNVPLRIYLLGDFRIENYAGAIELRHSKARALFAYLLLHSKVRHLREHLADLLWPESAADRAGRNLSDALYRLRQVIGDQWLTVERDAIALQPDADLWVDVWAFEAGVAANDRAAWEQAVGLYAGVLLPEFYDEWVLAWRTLLQEDFVVVLLRLGEWAEDAHLPERARNYFQQLTVTAPLREIGYQGLMRALAGLGRFGEAVAVYESCVETLERELGVLPDAETRALRDQLQGEREVVQQQTAQVQLWQRPFTGRITERATLIDALDDARQGRGGVIAIEGDAGMGKSRLLAEIVKSAEWRKMSVVQGTAAAFTAVSPFSPLTDSLSDAITGPRVAQLETMLADDTLATVAVLHEEWQPLATLANLPIDAAHKRFFQALVTICRTLTELSPHLLVLDDVQWAGPDFWQALDALVPMVRENRLLVLLSYRREAMAARAEWQFLENWERNGTLRVLPLQPLARNDVLQLLPPAKQVDVDEVLAGTGGNPYFVTEVLFSLAHGGEAYRETAVTRASTLPQMAQSALQAAAVIGKQVPYRVWAALVDLSPLQLAQVSEHLVRQYLLEPAADGYQFTHDLVREAIYTNIDPVQRRQFHQQIGALLADDPAQLRARAYHVEEAGETGTAVDLYRQIGEQDMASFAYTDAQMAFDRALALATDLPVDVQLNIYLQLIRACEVTGDQVEQQDVLKVALPLAKNHKDPALLISLLMEQGYFEMKQGEFDAADDVLREALALAERMNDLAAQGKIQERLGDMALRLGKNMEAVGLFETAVSLAQQTNNLPLEGRSLDGIGYALCQHSRPLAEYAPYFEKAIALHQQSGNPYDEARTLVSYFSTLQNGGAWDRVLTMADDVIAAQQAINYRRGEAIAYQAYGLAAGQLGDYVLAEQVLHKALAGFHAVGEPLGAAIATTALGSMVHRQGKLAEATAYFKDALAMAQRMESSMFVAMTQRDWSSLLVEMGEWETAVLLLQEAISIWIEQEDKLSQYRCETLLGLAYVGLGKQDAALAQAQAGWAAFQDLDSIFGEERELWLWELAQLCEKVGLEEETAVIIRAAYNELQTHARAIKDHAIRHRFFVQVPTNRAIVNAYDQQEKIGRTQQIMLAHKDAPLGRALTPDDMVVVQWTILAPEDEAIANKTERRRTQLKRLLTESTTQNATPTDDDLAAALNVSRRTILRDMQSLAAAGVTWQTRGRG